MKLYHGSNVAVRAPELLRSDRRLDFGAGLWDALNTLTFCEVIGA